MRKPRREFKPYQRDIYYADEMDHYLYYLEGKLEAIRKYCDKSIDECDGPYYGVKYLDDILEILDGKE